MPNSPETPQAPDQFLSSILKGTEKERVKLTPEIEGEVRAWLESCQARAERGEPLTEADREFMGNVRLWTAMPEWWRERLRTVEAIKALSDMKNPTTADLEEARERNITPRQWLNLLHMAKEKREKDGKKWIDETFTFPGGGKILAEKGLDLTDCAFLTELPENLSVESDSSTHHIYGSRQEMVASEVPLILRGCTGLKGLPMSLSVEGGIILSSDLQGRVIDDANRLEKNGKVDHLKMVKKI